MQSKLKEHFGDRIVITHANGKSSVEICQQKSDLEIEKIRLVQTAAKLIMSDKVSYDSFESENKCLSFLPKTLCLSWKRSKIENCFINRSGNYASCSTMGFTDTTTICTRSTDKELLIKFSKDTCFLKIITSSEDSGEVDRLCCVYDNAALRLNSCTSLYEQQNPWWCHASIKKCDALMMM